MIDLSHTPYNHNLFIRIQCFTKMRVFNEVFVTLSVLSVDTDHKQIYATHASAQLWSCVYGTLPGCICRVGKTRTRHAQRNAKLFTRAILCNRCNDVAM